MPRTVVKIDKIVALLEYLSSEPSFKALAEKLPDDVTRSDLDKGLEYELKFTEPIPKPKIIFDEKTKSWIRDPDSWNGDIMNKDKRIMMFSSFEEENRAEYQRRSKLSLADRIQEFSAIQQRIWGKDWTSKPIIKKAVFESVTWWLTCMFFSDDMKELLRLFEKHEVEYVLVGGFAVIFAAMSGWLKISIFS